MNQRLSAVAIDALQEALVAVFWYKDRLKSFLLTCVQQKRVVLDANWDALKRQIVAEIIGAMCDDQEKYLGDLRRLIHEICKMSQFPDLEKSDDPARRTIDAKKGVETLRNIVQTHDTVIQEANATRVRRQESAAKLAAEAVLARKLEEIKEKYMRLVCGGQAHKRGYELEAVMYELFKLFDLDPRAAFKNKGEQIDGAFTLDGVDYLFEAKWQTDKCAIQDLDAFGSKVKRKLDNTLGLFLSINGFSKDGVAAHSQGRPVTLLMTGADLMAVLEFRIDMVSLLSRKRKHAAQTGNILLEIHEILGVDSAS